MKRRIQRTCNEKDLVLFHYGELDAVARQRILEHLEVCQDCSARLAGLQRTLADLPLPGLVLSEVRKASYDRNYYRPCVSADTA